MSNPGATATEPVFNRRRVRLHRDRAARLGGDGFLVRHVGGWLADRLDDVTRRFPAVLELGARDGALAALLPAGKGVETHVRLELSEALARRGAAAGRTVIGDEEALPIAEDRFDLVISNLSLHWANDLPGALIQANRALRPDGLFLASLFGGDTLFELRRAMMEAEAQILGGLSPRVSPMTDLRDAGGLLQRAGFALPVADLDRVTVTYGHPLGLIRDLRAMGETHAAVLGNPAPPPKRFWPMVFDCYRDLFATVDGRVPASFEVITLTGWRPAHTQQQPARRGSGTVSLTQVLGGPKGNP